MGLLSRVTRGGLTVVATAGTAVAVAALASMLVRDRSWDYMYELFMFHNGPSAIVLLWMSRLVLRRQPRNGAGLVLLAIGVVGAVHVGVAALLDGRLMAAGVDLDRHPDLPLIPADLPLVPAILLLLLATVWVPAPALAATMLLLLFPDGRLPGPRWRVVAVAALAGIGVLVLAFTLDAWPTAHWPEGESPAAIEALIVAGGLVIAAAAAASVVALVRRWWKADPVQRRQFRAVGIAAIACAVVGIATYPWQQVWIPAVLIAFNALLVAYALAVARYRLHDLEPVLGRTAVGAMLAGLVAAVYLLVVVGAGSLVGRGVESTLLPLVAVGVVALLVEPVRRRARRLVDRWLYHRRADRTEVLSAVAARASTSVDADEILAEVASLLTASTGAARAEVWLAVDPGPQLAAAAGAIDEPAPALRAEVRHQGERLGELCLYARAAADLVPDARQLLDDVAHSLGVVLRNARLTAQLRGKLAELQASRRRLVQVHDQARRGLERDIHDGAQARLISVRLRLGLARTLAGGGDHGAVVDQLDQLATEVDAAVRSLRDLARGLHPPVLDQSGIAAALRAHLRTLPLTVAVHADGVGRYPRAVEGAVYFACLEAVQNAVRHSGASQVTVEVTDDAGGVRFCVRDNGAGFDPALAGGGAGLTNITDRITALGGQARVESAPGAGTRVSGSVPAADRP